MICYEDILPGYLRDVGALHPNLLVNLTSDSWFGAGSEPWEHLALAVYASVELRVAMVRAVNSGVSALIDPNGRLLVKTYADDPYRHPRAADGVVVTAPRMPGGDTVYVRFGYCVSRACASRPSDSWGSSRGGRVRARGLDPRLQAEEDPANFSVCGLVGCQPSLSSSQTSAVGG